MMKYQEVFINTLQSFVARISITPSSVRNQVEAGVINYIREYLAQIDLSLYSLSTQEAFEKELDSDTLKLKAVITKAPDLNWGTARKCLNIFLRDVLYNHYLRSHFNLSKLEGCLEIPMDSKVAHALLARADKSIKLPPWPGVKRLNTEENKQYQDFANKLAIEKRKARVHLDIEFWNS